MPSFCDRVGLMVAVPHSGRPVPPEWAWTLMNLHPPMNYNVRYAQILGKPVDVAREWLAEQAVAQGCKYLFFLGDDVTAPGHALRQLIYQMEHHPDAAVIGGIYCLKTDPAQPLVFRGNGHGCYWEWRRGEFFEVTGLGMDCTLINVEKMKQLPKPWFRTVDDASGFVDGLNHAEQWTEDLWFCKRVTDAGMKIYADGAVLCGHWDAERRICYGLPKDSYPMRNAGVAKGDKKIIDLGCGPNKLETPEGQVLGVDIRELPGVDYRCDLRVLPFASNEFDIVYSSHTLEHFTREEMPKVLSEWIRILKPDGELRLVLPNIEWAAEQILESKGELSNDTLNVLYGSQEYEQNFHKVGFTPREIRQLLVARGFRTIDIDASQYYNIIIRAWRTTHKLKNTKKKKSVKRG